MLEYLFDFMERNIILIFLCVLILCIASAYSKGIKCLFLSILGCATIYFALLCLYRLGIGIDGLYDWASNFVIRLCNYIDFGGMFLSNHSIISTKLLEILFHNTSSNIFLWCLHTTCGIALIVLAIEIIIPRIKFILLYKIQLNIKQINKKSYFPNTISRVQSRFILNSVFRC